MTDKGAVEDQDIDTGSEETKASGPAQKTSRSPILFSLVTLLAAVGAVLSVVGLTAGFSRVGLLFAFIGAAVLGGILPFFLVVRASASFKRRGWPSLVRHLISLVLYLVVHGAIFGVVVDWLDRSRADYAKAGYEMVSTFGEIPWLSGILKQAGEPALIVFGEPTKAPPEPNATPAMADGGPMPVGKDGGPADATDAGPKPPDGEAAAKLSERTTKGRDVQRAVFLAETDAGEPAIVLVQVKSGGGHKLELVNLSAHAGDGGPTSVSAAVDGSLGVVMAGAQVLIRGPGERLLGVRSLKRNATITLGKAPNTVEGQVRRIGGVVVGKKGHAVVALELFVTGEDNKGEVRQALVSVKGARVETVRMSGDALPEAPEDVAEAFTLLGTTVDGGYCVVESFAQGGASVTADTSGEKWIVNPERLLCGNLSSPNALVEAARTDSAAGGIEGRGIQRFYRAFGLVDGGAILHANFVEKGAETWVFRTSTRGGVSALAAASFGKAGAPFSGAKEKLDFVVDPSGRSAIAHGRKLFVGDIAAPTKMSTIDALEVFKAKDKSFEAAGKISNLHAVQLSVGGKELVALGSYVAGGRPLQAIVLASEADLKAGAAELIATQSSEVRGVKLRKIEPAP